VAEVVKISLGQQIEGLGLACTRQHAIASGKSVRSQASEKEERYQLTRLQAASGTLRWFRDNEDVLRRFMRLPPEIRTTVLGHGEELARLQASAGEADAEVPS
jgi:hypothetical protein